MRLRFPWFRRPQRHIKSSAELDASRRQAALNDIGALLQTRREEEGLTLRQLASETRITTPVIEALERGWGDRLPERAYLASMLPQLERRLALPDGSLNAVLPPATGGSESAPTTIRPSLEAQRPPAAPPSDPIHSAGAAVDGGC